MTLEVGIDGSIQMAGQDLGAAPLAAFGQHEYEFVLTVGASASPEVLARLLAEQTGTPTLDRTAPDSKMLIHLLSERYRGDPSAVDHFRDWLKEHRIESGFWNRMGD